MSNRSPEKTIGVTQSQILSTSPTRPEPPPPPRRKAAPPPQEMSVWGGNVLLSDDFTPDAGRKPRRHPWRLVGILVVLSGLAAAGGFVWRSWPRVPFLNVDWSARSTPPTTAAAHPATASAQPAPASPATAPSASATGSEVEAAPTEPPRVVKSAHSTKSIAKSKSHKRRHLKASKSSKRSHAKTTHRTAAASAATTTD
jgi:hypothetical protein